MDAKDIMHIANTAVVPNPELDKVMRGIEIKAAQGLTCFAADRELSEKTIAALRGKGFQVYVRRYNDSGQGRAFAHTCINADRGNEWVTEQDVDKACRDYNCQISMYEFNPDTSKRVVAGFSNNE